MRIPSIKWLALAVSVTVTVTVSMLTAFYSDAEGKPFGRNSSERLCADCRESVSLLWRQPDGRHLCDQCRPRPILQRTASR